MISEPGFLFDRCRRSRPEVARREWLLLAQATERCAGGLVRRRESAAIRATGEMVLEPAGFPGIEHAIEAIGQIRSRPGMTGRPVVGPTAAIAPHRAPRV